ncbi:hypothetical protein HPB51_024831 [Rhipicephalus microplus]|uniref:Nuclease harbi1-like protein n=1 Tax=Rhipicephalus microplus TaxID=6941 RepID=A0A9J6DK45_RHIMP|nr:hypothetical protein HPB51_024831 [Rhipicephalus microplus]
MTKTISVEKRVAVGMFHLCFSGEDRTIADLFGLRRSTFITVFKIVVDQLDYEGIRLVRARQLEKQIRECFFMSGFPQAVGAIDGSHFAVSPPKKHASDYYNYK